MQKIALVSVLFFLNVGAVAVSAQEGERTRLAKLLAQCLGEEVRKVMSEGWMLPHNLDVRLKEKCGFLEEKEREAFALELVQKLENESSREKREAIAAFTLMLREEANQRGVIVFSYAKIFDDAFQKTKAPAKQRPNAPAR